MSSCSWLILPAKVQFSNNQVYCALPRETCNADLFFCSDVEDACDRVCLSSGDTSSPLSDSFIVLISQAGKATEQLKKNEDYEAL